ncbi:rab11 family-interacting protein 1 isoform X1 [Hippocampus comes]|uniref:rab11 family-interacting protein 1 isoform X1 n=1 Tax=Hippocampus comes TaxID=109280 RepID=UPI00094E6EF1|nr:PREDICTED: rab11 family-interacting protein 1-like isoform X1 [Hippocampus comes]
MSLVDQNQQSFPTSVQVTVHQARHLRPKGKNGTNDAYAIIQVAKDKFSTAVAEKSMAPMWKEEASFDLPLFHPGNVDRCTLHIIVMHRVQAGLDKFLGQAVVNLLELYENKGRQKPDWFQLVDKSGKADKLRGDVLLGITFMRNNMSASMVDLSMRDKPRSRMSKLKDKVRLKKKDSFSDSGSAMSQVLTDSDGDRDSLSSNRTSGEKKKSKLKNLFAPKSNLQRNSSQSMSTLGTFSAKNSSLSGSRSSGINVETPEVKKKFKFLGHKRSGSSDSKVSLGPLSLLSRSKHSNSDLNNPSNNATHVSAEEAEARRGSTLSLNSSGQGSMENVHQRTDSVLADKHASVPLFRSDTRDRLMMEQKRQEEEERRQSEAMRLQEEEEKQRRWLEEENQRKADEYERTRRFAEEEVRREKQREEEEEERRRLEEIEIEERHKMEELAPKREEQKTHEEASMSERLSSLFGIIRKKEEAPQHPEEEEMTTQAPHYDTRDQQVLKATNSFESISLSSTTQFNSNESPSDEQNSSFNPQSSSAMLFQNRASKVSTVKPRLSHSLESESSEHLKSEYSEFQTTSVPVDQQWSSPITSESPLSSVPYDVPDTFSDLHSSLAPLRFRQSLSGSLRKRPPGSPSGSPPGSPPGSPCKSPPGSLSGSLYKSLPGSPPGSQYKSPPGSPLGSLRKSPPGSPLGSLRQSPPGSPPGSLRKSPPGSPLGSLRQSPPASPLGSLRKSPPASPLGSLRKSPPASPLGSLRQSTPGSPFGSLRQSLPGSPPGSLYKSPPGSPLGSLRKSPPGSPPGSPCRSPPASPCISPPGSPYRSPPGSPSYSVESSSPTMADKTGRSPLPPLYPIYEAQTGGTKEAQISINPNGSQQAKRLSLPLPDYETLYPQKRHGVQGHTRWDHIIAEVNQRHMDSAPELIGPEMSVDGPAYPGEAEPSFPEENNSVGYFQTHYMESRHRSSKKVAAPPPPPKQVTAEILNTDKTTSGSLHEISLNGSENALQQSIRPAYLTSSVSQMEWDSAASDDQTKSPETLDTQVPTARPRQRSVKKEPTEMVVPPKPARTSDGLYTRVTQREQKPESLGMTADDLDQIFSEEKSRDPFSSLNGYETSKGQDEDEDRETSPGFPLKNSARQTSSPLSRSNSMKAFMLQRGSPDEEQATKSYQERPTRDTVIESITQRHPADGKAQVNLSDGEDPFGRDYFPESSSFPVSDPLPVLMEEPSSQAEVLSARQKPKKALMPPTETPHLVSSQISNGDGLASTLSRPHPVKPMHSIESQHPTTTYALKDMRAQSGTSGNVKVAGVAGGGPFTQLTHEELITLVVRQQADLSKKDCKINELEDYIDNLLVRVIEEKPAILQAMNTTKPV